MLYLVVNKYSGNYSAKKITELKSELDQQFGNYEFINTVLTDNKVLIDLDHKKIRRNDTICAVGGDGTVNACLQFVHDKGLQKKVLLGVIPVGTGNNMIGSLNLKKGFKKAVQIIKEAKTEKIRYATINGERAFFNCSFGFTSHILSNRKTNSLVGYFYDTIRLLPSYKFCSVLIEGDTKEKVIFAGFFINTKVYMSKFRFLKKNNLEAGLQFFYIERGSIIDIPARAALTFADPMFYNSMKRNKYIIYPKKNCIFELDGDIYSSSKCNEPVTIENSSAVRVITNNKIK
jgi:diacylglycerol kinase (ATP)